MNTQRFLQSVKRIFDHSRHFWIILIIIYELQNVYAPHVNRFSIPESFISWTCFQHNRKCCFLLSSCRFCCWLYLCILTSSLNSSVLLFGKYIFQYYFNVTRDLSYKYPFLLTIYYVCYSLEWVVQILARAEMLKYYIKQSVYENKPTTKFT